MKTLREIHNGPSYDFTRWRVYPARAQAPGRFIHTILAKHADLHDYSNHTGTYPWTFINNVVKQRMFMD